MKKIAAILILVFALVQVVPAVAAIVSGNTTVLIIDEEQHDAKPDTDKKVKADAVPYYQSGGSIANKIQTAIHLAEAIHPAPVIEKVAPPPNQ